MAAAEARAAWQRTANRCLVQEDAKRAPKLKCCSSSSTLQNDSTNSNTTNGQELPASNFVPLNWNPVNSNLPLDTKWWLQLQPNFDHKKDFTSRQSSVLEDDLDEKRAEYTEYKNINVETIIDEIKLINSKCELDSSWVGSNKCGPWWHISDQEELASLVAQKSVEQIENCDLPRPTQTVRCSRNSYGCLQTLDGNKTTTSLSYNLHRAGVLQSVASETTDDKYWFTTKGLSVPSNDEELFRSDSNSSRAELLEALRHSQTRAREAEIAAQKAYNEKEHIIKIFFKQASHLFAYKQWLHILQAEHRYLQLKLKEHQISTLFPTLPWMPLNKNKTKVNEMRHKKKCGFCRYAVAFAIGLGLAGAGLLLGWTLGCLFL